TVYRRTADGGWEAIEDIISEGPLASAAAAPAEAPAANATEPEAPAAGNDTDANAANTVGM
ncbi:MAG: hypothetical protein ACT4OE_06225, partial [Sphingosinicella sp.]